MKGNHIADIPDRPVQRLRERVDSPTMHYVEDEDDSNNSKRSESTDFAGYSTEPREYHIPDSFLG